MRTIALCLAALLVVASATTDYKKMSPMNTKNARNVVKVMAQVEALLKSGGAYEIIVEVLDNFDNEITEEQAAHDGLYERAVEECASEFDFRRREVADASSALREGQVTLTGCEDQSRRAEADLKFTVNTLLETGNYLEFIIERREREAADFASETGKYEFNLHNIDICLEILDEIFTGEEEFVQLVRHSHKMMKDAASIGKVDIYAEVIASFAQLATAQGGADSALLEQLRNVLANTRDAIEENFADRTRVEEEFISEYETTRANTDATIVALTQQKSDLTIELASLNKCIVAQTGIVASATAKRDRNQRLWDDASALCGTQEAEYAAAKAQRREERDVIDALRQKVEARFGMP